MIYHRTSTMII